MKKDHGAGGHRGRSQPGGPPVFSFYAEYIMRNAELEEAQAGIKT